MILAVLLVVLHTVDGREVGVNPPQVTSLRPAAEGKHFTRQAQCMISLSDGKFVAVVETCAAVRRKLESVQPSGGPP
jgi:hypothetical protein